MARRIDSMLEELVDELLEGSGNVEPHHSHLTANGWQQRPAKFFASKGYSHEYTHSQSDKIIGVHPGGRWIAYGRMGIEGNGPSHKSLAKFVEGDKQHQGSHSAQMSWK